MISLSRRLTSLFTAMRT